MLTPDELLAIRERTNDFNPDSWNIPGTWKKAVSLAYDTPALLSHIDELEAKLAMPDISDADVINTSLSMQQQYELEQKIPKDLSKFKISITRKP